MADSLMKQGELFVRLMVASTGDDNDNCSVDIETAMFALQSSPRSSADITEFFSKVLSLLLERRED